MARDLNFLLKTFNLSHLDGEGGYFRFIESFGQNSGMIYYLITEDEFSHLHLLSEDEAWFFLEGDKAEQLTVDENGNESRIILDENNRNSLVKKGYFQATYIKEKVKGYTLFCTVMSPRFQNEMYTLATEEQFPHLKEFIL